MEALAHSLRRERTLHWMLTCFFMGKLLTPAQFAATAMHSYPFFPDNLALVSTTVGEAAAARAAAAAAAAASAGGGGAAGSSDDLTGSHTSRSSSRSR